MSYQKYDAAFIGMQFDLRRALFDALSSFSITNLKGALVDKAALLSAAKNLGQTAGADINSFFKGLEHFVTALFQVIEQFDKRLAADPGAPALRDAANLHLKIAFEQFEKCDADRPSVQALKECCDRLAMIEDISLLEAIVTAFKKIALSIVYSVDSDDSMSLFHEPGEISDDPDPESLVVSVLFYFDKELWANPQVIKPKHLYTLSGFVKTNYWPEGYTTLNLVPASTTNDSWYKLSLPSLVYSNRLEIPVSGHITMENPQSWFDKPIAIRLYAFFSGAGLPNLQPAVIGYDQLILKVVDPAAFPFPTGYESLNKKAYEIALDLLNEIPEIDREELTRFLILLSAILNYQGYCYQYGIYKGKSAVTEADFRDALIQHLSARAELAETLVKEGATGGGRVEIKFRGIVAELKVERANSDRETVLQAHEQQAAAYAASTGTYLSILCILDLTPKKYAPAPARANVIVRKPRLHGFSEADTPARVIGVFIDGNLLNPSEY